MAQLPAPLHRLVGAFASTSGWSPLAGDANVEISSKSYSKTFSLLRVSASVDLSVEELLVVWRPESMCGPCAGLYPAKAEVRLEKSYDPGDALVWLRPSMKGDLVKMALLLGPRFVYSDGCPTSCYYRMVTRRDLPKPGSGLFVMMPYDPERLQLVEMLNGHCCQLLMFVPEEHGGGRCKLVHVMLVLKGCRWVVPLMLQRGLFLGHKDQLPRLSFIVHARTIKETSNFTVIRLRRCTRGPPLTPHRVHAGTESDFAGRGLSWERSPSESFSLALYLSTLAKLAGVEGIKFSDTLDGRSLVFYEAAVAREHWNRACEAVTALFLEHRSHYRRLVGGTDAPFLKADAEPLFRDPPPEAPDSPSSALAALVPAEEEEEEEEEWLWSPPVCRTFIHYTCGMSVEGAESAFTA